jgi:hypothetical protein
MTLWQGAIIECGVPPDRSADGICDLGVGPRLPERGVEQRPPHLLLEIRACEIDIDVECLAFPGEILPQLLTAALSTR